MYFLKIFHKYGYFTANAQIKQQKQIKLAHNILVSANFLEGF